MARDRPRRFRIALLTLVFVVAVSILLIAVLTSAPGAGPISLHVVHISQNQSGSQIAVVELTNHTHYRCNVYAFWTEVLSNGVWLDALAQHPDARFANVLPPHAHRTLEVPLPREGTSWRIQMDALRPRPLNRVEVLLNQACVKLKLRSPVASELHLFSETNQIAAAPNPQVETRTSRN
jgi:hypothetical protein